MEQLQGETFSCSGCAKTYRWKSELAGKRVKCKCGQVMTVPLPKAPSDDPDLDALYELAESGEQQSSHSAASAGLRCPSCHGDIPAGDVVCPACGFNLRTGGKARPAAAAAVATAGGPASPILGYAATRKPDLNSEPFAGNQATELWIPIGLIAFGFVGSILQYTHFSKFTVTFGQALPIVAITLIIDMVMIAIGCLAAIKIMDVAFGSPGPAALKITAIAIAPGALANIVGFMFHSSMGIWVGSILSLIMYCALFKVLFDFDAGEIFLLSAIIYLIRMWLGMMLAAIVISALMGGIGGFGGGGGSSPKLNVDIAAEEALERPGITEAKPWIEDAGSRLLGQVGHDEGVKIINDLLSMGCKNIQVQKSGSQASMLIAELPSDEAKVEKIKAWLAKVEKEQDQFGVSGEVGRDYLLMNF